MATKYTITTATTITITTKPQISNKSLLKI